MINLSIASGGLIKNHSLYTPSSLSIKNTLSQSTLRIGGESIGNKVSSGVSEETKSSQLTLSFAESLLKNLTAANALLDDANKRSEEKKAELVNSIVATAEEIQKTFGTAEATRFMALTLTATESSFTEEKLTSAFTEFFSSVKAKAQTVLTKADATVEETNEAQAVLTKLDNFLVFLNGDENDDSASVALTINKYFGRTSASEDDEKFFTAEFKWMSNREIREEEEAKKAAQALATFVILKEELDPEAIETATYFLAETLASSNAAKVLEELEEDEDIFTAVDEVRSVLQEEDESALPTTIEVATESVSTKVLDEAVKSATKSALFNEFLNNYFLAEINKTLATKEEVGGRFTKIASFKTGVEFSFGTTSIASWPGFVAAQSTGVSISIGFEREFSISTGKDNKIKAKFSQSLKIETSFHSTSVLAVGSGVYAAGISHTLAQQLESRYTVGKITSNSNVGQSFRSSYLLSSVV